MTQQASQRREATLADKQSTSATNQSERFKQAVRERGCHDDPEWFKETVSQVASAKPRPSDQKLFAKLRDGL
jgi:DNA invertase Pin-like site-specific DNA recombinase